MKLESFEIEIKGKKYQFLDTQTGNPAILFIHGLGSNKDIMPKIFEPFLENYRCIFIDLPSHNKIPYYEIDTLDEIGEYVVNFIHGIHLNNFTLIGFSFGGVVAIQTQKMLEQEGIKVKAVAWASPLRRDFLTMRAKSFLAIVDSLNKKFYKKLPKSGIFKLVVALLGIKAKNSELESFTFFENNNLDKFQKMIPAKFIGTENREVLYLFGTKDPLINDVAFKKTAINKDYQSKYLIKNGGHYYDKKGREEALEYIKKFLG